MPGGPNRQYPLKPPAGDGRKRTFDPSTGNAARDGYTATGARRPVSRKPGDIMSAEAADRVDQFEADMEKWGDNWPFDFGGYSDE